MRLLFVQLPLSLLLVFASTSVNAVDTIEIRGAMAGTINGQSNLASDNSFTWDPQNFAGFYFDLDRDLSTESLKLNLSGSKIEAGACEYRTYPKQTQFRHKTWGNYTSLCFLGQRYFAGYSGDRLIAEAWNSLEDSKILSRVLIDSDEKMVIANDEAFPLKEGYSLKLSDVDNGVKILLFKGNSVVDSKVIKPPANYIYTAPIGNTNTTLLAVGVKANVKSEPKSYYSIKGLFQISEKTIKFDEGTEYHKMKISSSDSNGLLLKNFEEFDLSQESDIELMDELRLKSVNSEDPITNIRLYLYRNVSKLNGSIVRSAVAGLINGQSNLAADNSFTWSPQNFAGFYYDIEKDLGTETLKFVLTEGNKLTGDKVGDAPYGITYTTTAQQKRFKYGDWGHYSIIGFLGCSCFASYADDSPLKHASKDSNLLSNSKLGRVLIDSGERQKIQNGGTLPLQDGYEAKLYIDKSCNNTLVELYKNDTLVERNYFSLPGTYFYKKSFADIGEITVLALHLGGATCTQGKSCIVDGVFQISENFIEVNPDIIYGKMTIRGVDANAGTIFMDNKDKAITLSKNIDALLMGDFHIRTADSDELRFYICRPMEPDN